MLGPLKESKLKNETNIEEGEWESHDISTALKERGEEKKRDALELFPFSLRIFCPSVEYNGLLFQDA